MVSKTKYPGICNNCGRKSEFYIEIGVHSMQFCRTCAIDLSRELTTCTTEAVKTVETGLISDITNQQKVE